METTITNRVRGSITPHDSRQAFRLVGFLEYGKALGLFDQLLAKVTEEELEAIDQLVRERPEFTVYTNLSRRLQRRPSSLAEPTDDTRDFAGRGFAWVIGLARVELGAMLAAYTGVQHPFEAVQPTEFEMPQYGELLLDGTRTHYWALLGDPELKRVTRLSPSRKQFLSYSRRLILARAMLRGALKAKLGQYTPLQMRELARWKRQLDDLQAGFVIKIRDYLAGDTQTIQRTSRQQFDTVQACGALLRAENREIRSGNARVINLNQ